jgi:hypothetical protein
MKEITVTKSLPDWADVQVDKLRGMTFIVVDVDKVYPAVVDLLGGEKDQFWAEIARRCITRYLRELLGQYNLKLIGSAWSLAKLPPGKGEAAAMGEEHLPYYNQIKGQLGELPLTEG